MLPAYRSHHTEAQDFYFILTSLYQLVCYTGWTLNFFEVNPGLVFEAGVFYEFKEKN